LTLDGGILEAAEIVIFWMIWEDEMSHDRTFEDKRTLDEDMRGSHHLQKSSHHL
jgi:hypothetical protein